MSDADGGGGNVSSSSASSLFNRSATSSNGQMVTGGGPFSDMLSRQQQKLKQLGEDSAVAPENQFVDDLVSKLLEEDSIDIDTALFGGGDAGRGGAPAEGGRSIRQGRLERQQQQQVLPDAQQQQQRAVQDFLQRGCDMESLGLQVSQQLRLPLQTLNGFNNLQVRLSFSSFIYQLRQITIIFFLAARLLCSKWPLRRDLPVHLRRRRQQHPSS